jgi:hypothetical protein
MPQTPVPEPAWLILAGGAGRLLHVAPRLMLWAIEVHTADAQREVPRTKVSVEETKVTDVAAKPRGTGRSMVRVLTVRVVVLPDVAGLPAE